MGYEKAQYKPSQEKEDIRDILQKEVVKYRNKFLLSLLLNIPILVLMWVIPYTMKDFVTATPIYNNVPLWIFLLLGFSTIIQFYMGADFYKGAYKSVKHCSANMDVLVVLGTTAAWAYGVLLIFVHSHDVKTGDPEHDKHLRHMLIHEHGHNFEIASTLITIILLGKFFESFSKKQTVDKLSQLASCKVTQAMLVYKKPRQDEPEPTVYDLS